MIKKFSKLKMIIFYVVLLIAAGICIFYFHNVSEIQKENKKDFDNGFNSLNFTIRNSNGDLKYLESLLTKQYLNDEQKGMVYANIAYIYHMKNNSLDYHTNIAYAFYYLEKSGNVEDRAKAYCDLCSFYMEHDAYKEAEEVINEVSDIVGGGFRMKDFETYSRYFKYKACIEMQNGNYEEAHDDFERSRQKLNYEDNSDVVQQTIAMINLQEAKCYFIEGKYHLAYQLLRRYSPLSINKMMPKARYYVSEYQLPYYEMMVRMAQYKHEYGRMNKYLNFYYSYAETYGFYEKQLDMFNLYMSMDEDKLDDYDYQKNISAIIPVYNRIFNKQHNEIIEVSKASISEATNKVKAEEIQSLKATIDAFIVGVIVFIALTVIIFIRVVINQAQVDKLTGVFNRRNFDREILKYEEKEQMISAIMFDIDDFKQVNDNYGHEVGDYVLKEIGIILKQHRTNMWHAYRYGGEEFVLVSAVESPDEILNKAESLRKLIESHIWKHGLNITVSVGVSRNCKPNELIQRADQNLYYAKRHGKNVVCYSLNEKSVLLKEETKI